MSENEVIGEITRNHSHDVVSEQTGAWAAQCKILKSCLSGSVSPLDSIFFEFSIPRMGRRADVVLIIDGIVFVIEFKIGSTTFNAADRRQAIDYALDLKSFHSGSHDALVVPVLVASKAVSGFSGSFDFALSPDGVADLVYATGENLGMVIDRSLAALSLHDEDAGFQRVQSGLDWADLPYKPTPTIVQAAQALYSGHNVEDISRNDAGAKNLTLTASAISEVIRHSKNTGSKSICFVTGVPGAGKTLAGLNVATKSMSADEDEHAVFLSGNRPLVEVLTEALARDERDRFGTSKKESKRKAETFIQNIHHFRDDSLSSSKPPAERVVVFDEAQRAWNREQTSKFMKRKKGVQDFDQSEPEFLIEVMDRHEGWCVIVALVGGGQEINTGEAGLPEWFKSLQRRFRHWDVYFSERLGDSACFNGLSALRETPDIKAVERPDMHLSVSMRSFRAEAVSEFVEAVLGLDPVSAAQHYRDFADAYPITITRNMDAARTWLDRNCRGSELAGIIASSGAKRLRPEGLVVQAQIEPAAWFLNGPEDVRSCQHLEGVATEFDVQGLELDWTCVGWDANLRLESEEADHVSWSFHRFEGSKWKRVNDPNRREYLLNSYRVLLTRARQGMVIFVPWGSENDATRPPQFYQSTYDYLKHCGIPELVSN